MFFNKINIFSMTFVMAMSGHVWASDVEQSLDAYRYGLTLGTQAWSDAYRSGSMTYDYENSMLTLTNERGRKYQSKSVICDDDSEVMVYKVRNRRNGRERVDASLASRRSTLVGLPLQTEVLSILGCLLDGEMLLVESHSETRGDTYKYLPVNQSVPGGVYDYVLFEVSAKDDPIIQSVTAYYGKTVLEITVIDVMVCQLDGRDYYWFIDTLNAQLSQSGKEDIESLFTFEYELSSQDLADNACRMITFDKEE